MREVAEYGCVTPLQIARFAQDLDFLSHTCVQNIVIDRWYSKLMPDNYKILVKKTRKFAEAVKNIYLNAVFYVI